MPAAAAYSLDIPCELIAHVFGVLKQVGTVQPLFLFRGRIGVCGGTSLAPVLPLPLSFLFPRSSMRHCRPTKDLLVLLCEIPIGQCISVSISALICTLFRS